MNLLFLQDTATIAINAAGKAEKELSYIGLLISGGGFMIPIGILSLLAFYITIERYLAIKKAGEIDPKFMLNIKDFVTHGNIDAALALAKQTNTPIARLIEKGIKRIGRPLNDISTAIENEGKLEVYKLERSLPLLATVAGAAPMIGFLGTVWGMILAFKSIADAGSSLKPGDLASGIYVAMVTTLGGLIVGIIALIAYNLLVAMVENVIYKMENTSVDFIDLLQEPA